MQMPIHKCSYTGAMNKDTSFNNYPQTCYYDATNLRVVSGDSSGSSDTSLSTVKGNALSFTIPDNGKLLGYTVLRDDLLILVHAEGYNNPDRIYKIPISSLRQASALVLDNVYYWNYGSHYLVYWNDLNFQNDHPIKVVANYENENVKKIYWIDGLNSLRHLNIVYDKTYNNLSSLSPELLEISPNHTYGSYSLTESTGGNLKACRIQYSYQLYSISGTETMFAPPSNLYNVTTHNLSDGAAFTGSDLETIVNKSIAVTITFNINETFTFNRIRLIALEYEVYGDIPKVRIVSEQELKSNVVTIYDHGETIGELTLEEFQITKNDFIPKTIESVKNYLFAGNVTEEFFDVDSTIKTLNNQARNFFDSRAYRWRYIKLGDSIASTQILNNLTDPHAIQNISGYTSNSFDTTPALLGNKLTDANWDITVNIGAAEHATSLARTFNAISGINGSYVEVAVHVIGGDWLPQTLKLSNIAGFSYTPNGDGQHGALRIWGTGYQGSYKPSNLNPSYPNNYDKTAVITLDYSYSYSIASVSNTAECVLNKGNVGSSTEFVVDNGVGIVNFDVPENHDCINTYNNIKNDEDINRAYEYKYKKILGNIPPVIANLGGTGRFISFEFTSHDEQIGTYETIGVAPDVHPIISSTTLQDAGYKDPKKVYDYTSHQRDEVYRYGLVLLDLKGRPSYPKWIADIRFPKISEELNPGVTWSDQYQLAPPDPNTPTTIMHCRALGVQFTINWDQIELDHPGLLNLISGFQFVRMQRTANDTTIKANGLLLPMAGAFANNKVLEACYSTYTIPSGKDYELDAFTEITGITENEGLVLFRNAIDMISPEVAFNKSLLIDSNNDFLQPIGYLNNILSKTSTSDISGTPFDRSAITVASTTITPYNTTNTNIKNSWRKSITGGFVSLPEPKGRPAHVVAGVPFVSRGYDGRISGVHPKDPFMTYKGTTLETIISSSFTNVTSGGAGGEFKAIYGYYRKYLGYSAYGGCTYSERTYNQYLKASEFQVTETSGTTNVSIYNGDVYIVPFTFLKLMFDTKAEYGDNKSGQVTITFPVETKINIPYRSDPFQFYWRPDKKSKFYMSEFQSTGVSQYPDNYPSDLGNLYRYNSAYSAENISKVFVSKPFDFRTTKSQDTVVVSSDSKFPGEYKDSWLSFKYNNYQTLDGECGSLTRLLNKNDKLVAIQQKGISAISVLERELIQSNNTAALAVGSGGILSRYDYINRAVGTSNYDAIVDTELGLYFYDDNTSTVYRFLDSLEAISDTKNMKSYFDNKRFTSLITAYDKHNREVLFSPGTIHREPTLCFSGFVDAFTSFYTLRDDTATNFVQKYVTFDKYVLSSLDSNSFYLHDAGNYNQFYGTIIPSSLTIIANPAQTIAASFHVIQWLMDVIQNGVEIPNVTFDSVQITDTYQDTGVLTFPGDTGLMRRFRTWRMNIFRDALDQGRIRDSWIKVKFIYTPSPIGTKGVIHPIEFAWIPTKIR